ncbi:hypothetical protein P692DRAFT_20850573 [Suillus brevipes Sb2]|nr:hypothetical protein P692DRAFT_20850573 [Suillus brevipes Sb2]
MSDSSYHGSKAKDSDSAQLVVDASNESDAAKKQPHGKSKAHADSEDLDPKDKPFQPPRAHPSNMSSHISFGMPVTHKTVKNLTPTFPEEAKLELSKPNFILVVSCKCPPVAVGTQRNFKCTPCCDEHSGIYSWLQDLREAYIHETYQLDTYWRDASIDILKGSQRPITYFKRKGSKVDSIQLDLLQQSSSPLLNCFCLIVSLPLQQQPPSPIQAPSPPLPMTQAASVYISLGMSQLLSKTPDQFLTGCLPPLLALPLTFSGPCQTLPSPATPTMTHSNASQDYKNALVDPRHVVPQRHPVNDLPDAVTHNFNTGTGVAFPSADLRLSSCNVAGLKSDMATLSDGLAKLATEDPSESRHIVVTRSLEDRILLLILENGELKQGVAAKCLEHEICLLEVENDQLQDRLLRQDQELEERAVKGLEQKICQLKLTLQQNLPVPGDTQIPGLIADTNLKDLVFIICV